MIASLPVSRARQRLPAVWIIAPLAGLLIYVLARPLVAITHELALLGATGLFSLIHYSSAGWALVQIIPGDPIYTGAVASLLSDVDAAGLALAGPLGAALHARWPTLFLDPGLVPDGAFVSALILPGSTLVARGLSFLMADVLVLAIGWVLWLWATSGHRSLIRVSLALAAAVQQLHVVLYHHLVNRVTLRDLESLGVPFALSALQRGAPQDRPRVTAWMANLPAPAIEAVVNLVVAIFAAVLSFVVALAVRWAYERVAHLLGARASRPSLSGEPATVVVPDGGREHQRRTRGPRSQEVFWRLLWVPALVLAASPLGAFADADSRVLGLADDAVIVISSAEATASTAAMPTEQSRAAEPVRPAEAPIRVDIEGGNFHYRYLLNGQPTTIYGMGYNVRYADLPDAERQALYDRDFALMRSMGVNTIVGWEAREFDELMLDRAAAHGLGVVPPLELRPDLDYTNESVRAEVLANGIAWVQRYKNHPAIRMWALGNEILHKLVFPSWMSVQADPWREERAHAFASLLVSLADTVRAEDPLHPVVYTDAEDAYVGYVREAIVADGRDRPWFVYGINVYTPRLRSMIETWPTAGFDTPLYISEFAPGGLSAQDRPAGLRDMWDVVQSFDDGVLGGAVYAWTIDGPEEVDRVFGLVDSEGNAVDGALSAVARMYGGNTTTALAGSSVDSAARVEAADEPLHEVARTAFMAIEPDLPEDAESDETATTPGTASTDSGPSTGQLQVARVVDATDTPDDAAGTDDAWWVTWRSSDRKKRQLAMLVERDDAGQPRVYYVHRPRQ
jgi:hypothetical protein